MASDINVQDNFLEKAKNEKIPVAVNFGKIKMIGIIKCYDQFSITLESNGQDQMVYKQGINYIGMQKPKRAFKPRPGGFKPRDGQDTSSGDAPRRSFTPRPGGFRPREDGSSDDRKSFTPRPRPSDTEDSRPSDSYQHRSPKEDSQSFSENRSENRFDSSKNKTFRVQKPPKKY